MGDGPKVLGETKSAEPVNGCLILLAAAAPTTSRLSAPWNERYKEPGSEPSILILDPVEVNRHLLRAMLRQEPYRIREARKPAEAFEFLEKEKIDLIIVEMMIPGLSGPEFCRKVKSDRRWQLIPILMMSTLHGVENELAGITSGADEFLLKPLHPAIVRARVQSMLRHKAAIDTLEEAESILFGLAQAIEYRDNYTAGHCQRIAWYSVSLGMALGMQSSELLALHRGGFLHDIGKIAVPDAILHKNGDLTPEEWEIMRSHTVKGEAICRPMKSLQGVLPIIRYHHERWDGSGYPDGLRGEEIPLVARVLQIADIFDALTTARPYKPAYPPQKALEILREETARGWRDPELVEVFSRLHAADETLAQATMGVHWQQLELLNKNLSSSYNLSCFQK